MIRRKIHQKILSLALPAFLTMITHTIIMITDTAILGQLGSNAIAAAGLGGFASLAFLSLFFGGAVGVQILTSHFTRVSLH